VFDEAIEPVVFAHIFEEVFLIPSGEHGGANAFQPAKIGTRSSFRLGERGGPDIFWSDLENDAVSWAAVF